MKATDIFIRALENEGVRYIFGVPGEENLDFLESLRQSSIRFIVTRHEQAAGFMAATYGRLTGKTGVCLSTLGPGATNLVTAAAYAQLGAMPMLMITGQKPIKKSKQGQFQIINVVNLMRPLTKYTKQIVNGTAIPFRVREAFRLAEEERPGAVHLELPEDVAQEEADESDIVREAFFRRPVAEEKAIEKAVELIEKAKHPLLMVGAGANRKMACQALRVFVDRFKIPFFDTQMGKGVVDGRHERYLGNAALSENDFLHCAIEKADLIINAGHDVVEKPPFFMMPKGPKVIHIHFSSASVDPVYFPQLEVVGDIANSITRISELLKPQEKWDFAYYQRIRSAFVKDLEEDEMVTRFPVTPQRLVYEVRQAMPEDGLVTLDNGIYKIWFARNYLSYSPNTLLLDNSLAAMGAGLPSAIAAALVYPDKKIMAICGDGGFMMNSQEMETAVRLKINLVILIVRDDAFGMIRWKQKMMGFSDYAMDFKNPDFVKYSESYGAKGYRIKKTEEIVSCIQKAYEQGGVHLIEIPVDYTENEKVLTQEMRDRICVI